MLNLMRNLLGGSSNLVDGKRAHELVASGATLLDVRTPEEFAGGSVPKAVNIPVQVLEGRMGEVKKSKPVVIFCRSGARSARAAAMMNAAGYEAYDAGGIGNLR